MIGSLRGQLLARSADGELLVEVAGVGYRVVTTPKVAAGTGELGSEVFLHVSHVVRDDAQLLFGFTSIDQRQTFEALVGTRGVGPTLARSILAIHEPDELRRAVATDDVDSLCLVNGVGPKTAVRLLVELKSRLDLPEVETPPVAGTPQASGVGPSGVRADVQIALQELGYSAQQARNVVGALSPEVVATADASQLLKEALRQLAGNTASSGA